jgi:hypothetical protein
MKRADDFQLSNKLNFPVGLKGELIFDEEVIRLICQIVGIDFLQIKTKEGKTSIEISRIGEDGSATMGQATYLPKSTSDLKNFNVQNLVDYSSFHFSSAEVMIDLEQIYNELLTQGESYASARDAGIWAEKINSILKQELLKLVWMKQKINVSNLADSFFTVWYILVIISALRDMGNVDDTISTLKFIQGNLWNLLAPYLGKALVSVTYRKYKQRVSILLPFGPELDRAIASSLLIWYHSLVTSKEA